MDLREKRCKEFQYKRAFANFALKIPSARGYFNAIAANKKHPYNEEGFLLLRFK